MNSITGIFMGFRLDLIFFPEYLSVAASEFLYFALEQRIRI